MTTPDIIRIAVCAACFALSGFLAFDLGKRHGEKRMRQISSIILCALTEIALNESKRDPDDLAELVAWKISEIEKKDPFGKN